MDRPGGDERRHIEIDQLNGLIAAAGVDGAREILDAFWKSTEELLDLMSTQVNEGDLALAAKTAHALKGMAANVGASKLSATASEMEEACRNNEAGGAPDHMREARADFEAARGWLLEHLKQAS